MSTDWNELWMNSDSQSNSDFGNLNPNETYNIEITDAKVKTGSKLLIVKAKTITGETGLGSFVTGFYTLDSTKEEKFRAMDANAFKKLADATDFDLTFTSGKDDEAILSSIATDLPGKRVSTRLKKGTPYQGKDSWLINNWEVKKAIVSPADVKPKVADVPEPVEVADPVVTDPEHLSNAFEC